jgi:hypothetical protein
MMVDGHFKFYKRVTDDPEFAKTLLDWLFERYLIFSFHQKHERLLLLTEPCRYLLDRV